MSGWRIPHFLICSSFKSRNVPGHAADVFSKLCNWVIVESFPEPLEGGLRYHRTPALTSTGYERVTQSYKSDVLCAVDRSSWLFGRSTIRAGFWRGDFVTRLAKSQFTSTSADRASGTGWLWKRGRPLWCPRRPGRQLFAPLSKCGHRRGRSGSNRPSRCREPALDKINVV